MVIRSVLCFTLHFFHLFFILLLNFQSYRTTQLNVVVHSYKVFLNVIHCLLKLVAWLMNMASIFLFKFYFVACYLAPEWSCLGLIDFTGLLLLFLHRVNLLQYFALFCTHNMDFFFGWKFFLYLIWESEDIGCHCSTKCTAPWVKFMICATVQYK